MSNTPQGEFITQQGLQDLKEQLEHLKVVVRKEVSEKIKTARGFGDLSENAEYDEAKNEQAEVEAKIAQIEEKIKTAQVIDESQINSDVVGLGSKVKILDVAENEEMDFSIVGSAEADFISGKLSYDSPVGAALLNHEVGDVVKVDAPDGTFEFKILEINR